MGAADPNYTFGYHDGSVTVNAVVTGPLGYVAYSSVPALAATTTTGTFTIATSVSLNFTVPVAAGQPFNNYTNLTVQTNNGPWGIFCKVANGVTTLSTCTSGGQVAQTVPVGALVTDAAFSTFDVYTIIPGGKTAVQPSSVTVVSDVPSADRALPSFVAATASTGLIKYTPSLAPSGTFTLTFGYCNTGTATYSAANPACHTGTLQYGPTVNTVMAAKVTAGPVTQVQFQTVGNYAVAPTTAPAGTNFTAYVAPATTQVPRLQFAAQINGDVTINSAKNNTLIFPIPAGATYVSAVATGGDQLTSANSLTPPQITFCPTKTSPGCVAQTSAHYSDTTAPYLQVITPITLFGGNQATLPTIAITLTASGPVTTDLPIGLSELTVATSTSLAATNFRAYPSDSTLPLDASGNPATVPMTPLSTTKIT